MTRSVRHCADCRVPLEPDEPPRGDEALCAPCADLRELAWNGLTAREQAAYGVRRGPRHRVPAPLAARVALQAAAGTLGSTEPLLEISRYGFRVATLRRMDAGQRLECEVFLPGAAGTRLQLDVEVRWSRREGSHWEIGVEVAEGDAERFGELYARQVAAIDRG